MHIVKQHDQRDCGAACLSMIAYHFGLQQPLHVYRNLTKTDRNGTNLYGIVDGAKQIGLEANALYGTIDELTEGIEKKEISYPFIAHVMLANSMLHYVVVFKHNSNGFVVGDPALGKVTHSVQSFLAMYTGYIIIFSKTEKFIAKKRRGTLSSYFFLLKGQKKIITSILFLSLFVSLAGIVGSFVFQGLIDNFYSTAETDLITTSDNFVQEQNYKSGKYIYFDNIVNVLIKLISNYQTLLLLLIFMYSLSLGIQIARGYLISLLAKRIDLKLILSYFYHVVDLPIFALNTRQTAEYLSRFSDATAIRNAVSGSILTLLLDSIMVVFCGIVLFYESQRLTLISVVIVLLYVIIVILYKKPIRKFNLSVMEDNASLQSYVKESVDGLETIKTVNAESIVKEITENKFRKLITHIFAGNMLSITLDSLVGYVEIIGSVIVLWVGFGMVLANTLSLGTLITFYALLAYFTEPIKNLVELLPNMQSAIVAAERLNDILESSSENVSQGISLDEHINNVCLKDICFRYGNRARSLEGISLTIRKGEKIAIVGESGCGKTTLVKLLLGIHEIECGTLLINGCDIREIQLKDIRNRIAYLDQNAFFFTDSINNNLRLGNQKASDEDVINACLKSYAADFITELPLQYNTCIEENGSNISSGQRQRLAIARALLREPEILIIDEATSNLESRTEQSIYDSILDKNNHIICIFVTHRLELITNCDQIYVMSRGMIVEAGKHEELLVKNGTYSTLWRNGSSNR